MVELLRQLVEMESPSTEKQAVDRLGHFLADHIRQCGLEPRFEQRSTVGDIIWAEWEGSSPERILVLCHIDTVWELSSLQRNPFRIENGRLYGPGIFDMKSGVAATMKIQEYLNRSLLRPRKKIRFLYTTDEEIGSNESRALIEEFARQSQMVLLTEPPLAGGVLKTFRKGVADFTLKIRGRAAHAGLEPEKGLNALEELARQIVRIQALSNPELGTTVNVTKAHGGTRENVIPEYAEATVDARFRTLEEASRIEGDMRKLSPHIPGVQLEVLGGVNRPPMLRTHRTEELFAQARLIAAEMGIDLREGGTGGGSDGSFTAALGIPTLDGLGVNGGGAHAVDEHIELAALSERVALLARLVERL
ncbi:MAG: M20 family metallopeptidase [Acidobacteria bacterium]|nr:M20 family metallopeptidase [Acidobacteriota bacterium]